MDELAVNGVDLKLMIRRIKIDNILGRQHQKLKRYNGGESCQLFEEDDTIIVIRDVVELREDGIFHTHFD